MKKWYRSKTLWTNVLSIAALAIQSQIGWFASPEVQAAGLAVINLGLRFVTDGKVEIPKIKSGPIPFVILLLLLPMMHGCSVVKAVDDRPVLTELSVRIATGRVLDAHPEWVATTMEITHRTIRVINEGETVPLSGLKGYIQSQIPWGQLSPEEIALLQMLIDGLEDELRETLAEQGITDPGEIRVRVATVLGWIYQSAEIRSAEKR